MYDEDWKPEERTIDKIEVICTRERVETKTPMPKLAAISGDLIGKNQNSRISIFPNHGRLYFRFIFDNVIAEYRWTGADIYGSFVIEKIHEEFLNDDT